MLGEPLGGEAAVSCGLATRCVEADVLEEETMAFASKLARGPLYGYARQKELMMKYFYNDLSDYYADEAEFMANCSHTEDFAEAVDAFLEKRKPSFKGK
jgi:2-(1,2-epoxy-1,2-dihydrophenyl)acetyl-CoA isomerase